MATVLITGCNSGFGLAGALAFARNGDNVYATMRNPDKAGPLQQARSERQSSAGKRMKATLAFPRICIANLMTYQA